MGFLDLFLLNFWLSFTRGEKKVLCKESVSIKTLIHCGTVNANSTKSEQQTIFLPLLLYLVLFIFKILILEKKKKAR